MVERVRKLWQGQTPPSRGSAAPASHHPINHPPQKNPNFTPPGLCCRIVRWFFLAAIENASKSSCA